MSPFPGGNEISSYFYIVLNRQERMEPAAVDQHIFTVIFLPFSVDPRAGFTVRPVILFLFLLDGTA